MSAADRRRSRAPLGWIAACAALGGGLAAGGVVAADRWLATERPPPGMTIGGAVAPSDRPLGDWLEQRREAMLDDEVVLDASGELVTLTLGQLGVELDVADTLQRAREHIKAGGLRERLARAYRAWRGEEDVPLSTSFDRDRARQTLSLLAPSVRQEPVDAHLDLHNRRRVLERPGRQLDVEGTVDVIAGGE
ncbi:MAG TPA: peptidoglycan binding domain-containing protein, partial [Polyangiaceae bacterium]|nr:peptidoglycan binding domain-containing protein [Polyangiaceae bacterium]